MDTMEILGVWRQWMEVQNAPSTTQGYYRAVWAFLLTVPGVPLVEITERHIVEWLETFPHRSSARTTYMHGLKHLFAYMMRHPEIGLEKDPTTYIKVLPPEEKSGIALFAAGAATEFEPAQKSSVAKRLPKTVLPRAICLVITMLLTALHALDGRQIAVLFAA